MAQKYHTQILSEERSKNGREVIIRERPVKCSGTSDCEFCSSERRSRRPSKLDFASYSGSSSRSSSVKDRLPTPYNFEYKPVRRSSRDGDTDRHRERRPSERDHYYSDGERMGDYNLRRTSVSRAAAQPIPIPKAKPRRASTMYEDDSYDRYYNAGSSTSRRTSDRDSWRRSSPSRHESARMYPGFYDTYSSSVPAKESSPRPSRHRHRHSVDVHQDEAPISYGSSPVTNSHSSTPWGSYRSSDLHSRATSVSQSPPKSVRWGDDPRALQNAKIDSRPKISRSASISGAGTGSHLSGEVKSILKNSTSASVKQQTEAASAPAVQDLTDDQYAALYKTAQSIGVEDRATSPQRRLMRERATRDYEPQDMMDNLRRRIGGRGDRRYSFDMPPRRFTGSYGEKPSSVGKRSEAFYDDRYDERRW